MDKNGMSRGLGHHSEDVSHEKQTFLFPIYLHQMHHDLFPPVQRLSLEPSVKSSVSMEENRFLVHQVQQGAQGNIFLAGRHITFL